MFDAVQVNGIPDLFLFGRDGMSVHRGHDVPSLARAVRRALPVARFVRIQVQ